MFFIDSVQLDLVDVELLDDELKSSKQVIVSNYVDNVLVLSFYNFKVLSLIVAQIVISPHYDEAARIRDLDRKIVREL